MMRRPGRSCLPERCGAAGTLPNFCDLYALKFAPSMEELRLLQAEWTER
jgi:hypothetical protein